MKIAGNDLAAAFSKIVHCRRSDTRRGASDDISSIHGKHSNSDFRWLLNNWPEARVNLLAETKRAASGWKRRVFLLREMVGLNPTRGLRGRPSRATSS